MATSSETRTASQVIQLTFGTEKTDNLNLESVVSQLNGLNIMLAVLTEEHKKTFIPLREAHFEVVAISYNSPLEVLLAAVNLPKVVWDGLVTFLKNVVYHNEIKSKLAAQAAQEWRAADAARLKNAQTALEVVGKARSMGIDDDLTLKLLGVHESLERGPLKLTGFKSSDDDPTK